MIRFAVLLNADDFIQRLAFSNQPQSFGSETFLAAGVANSEQNDYSEIFRDLQGISHFGFVETANPTIPSLGP